VDDADRDNITFSFYNFTGLSDYKVYVYIVKHNLILGDMLFTIRKEQLHVSALNVGHLQVCTMKTYQSDIHAFVGGV
jgi:hypothetical protein